MEPWITESITINGDLSYAIRKGEINNRYVDIEIVSFSDRWSDFDAVIEFREREGAEWRSDMQILYSTANSVDKNRLRKLLCSSSGSFSLIRWDYTKNGLKYGQNPDIRLKILPKYVNFSTSNTCGLVSRNGGINESEFIDSSIRHQPINLNQSGQIISLSSTSVGVYDGLSSDPIYTYSGLSSPSFAIQILNGNYFIADTGNNLVLEVSEDMSTFIDSISVPSPIFLDYIEDSDTLLVTSSGGTVYEYIRGSFILVWTSSTSFGNLTSATYSKKDVNRIVTADTLDNKIRIINKLTGEVVVHSGFYNSKGDSDSFVKPNLAIELEDGSITVIEKIGRTSTFEEYVSSSSSSLDSSSTSSMTSSSLSSSTSSEGFTSESSSSSGWNSSSDSSSSSSSSSSEIYSESSSSSSELYSESSSSSGV